MQSHGGSGELAPRAVGAERVPVNSDAVMTPKPIPTSRRAVLRTGVRLAYATPVVAVSMKLSTDAASAQVSGPAECVPVRSCAGFECGPVLDGCGGLLICGGCTTGFFCGPENTCEPFES